MVSLDLLCSPKTKLIVILSLRSSPVRLQKPTKPLMTDDLAIFGLRQGGNDIVAYALMWPLFVVVLHIF